MNEKLSPGCMIAWAFSNMENAGDKHSIKTIRDCMELAPTYPEAWTLEDGEKFVRDYLGSFYP